MVEKGIQELCSLYTEMTRRFRDIKLNLLDEENVLEHIVLDDMKAYLMELLAILPRDIDIHFSDRLVIRLWRNAPYYNRGGESLSANIILIDDAESAECMVVDENFQGLQFAACNGKTEYLRLGTLEFMCSNWKELKKSILNQTAEQLDDYILKQLERIKGKQEKLQAFKDWGHGI